MPSPKQLSTVSFFALVITFVILIVASVHDAQADDPPANAAGWWKSAWKSRVEVRLPEKPQRFLRVAIPDSARPAALRCLLTGRDVPLEHWVQSMQMTPPVRILASLEVPYRFPRMVRASNGHLLLFYNVGASQSSHHPRYSLAAMRESTDDGKTWSPERLLWQEEEGYSVFNLLPYRNSSGRILLWTSRYQYSVKPHIRHPGLWTYTEDHGQTFAELSRFDASRERSSYYMTCVSPVSDGLLGGMATFGPSGVGKCYTEIWHSSDDGRTWSVRSRLTQPDENLGNEVALLETKPGTILCLLRDRHYRETYRIESSDGGRTWAPREKITQDLGCVLQRPVFTRFDSKTVLLSGRDHEQRQTVLYLSRDNAQSFAERHVVDSCQRQGEGGYTTTVLTGPRKVLMAWYTDGGSNPLKPDIKLATITVADQPQWLWLRLPEKLHADATLHVYYDNETSSLAESRGQAMLHPHPWTAAQLSQPERIGEP